MHLHKQGQKIIVLARNYDNSELIDDEIPFKIIRMKGVGFKLFRIPLLMYYLAKTVIRNRIRTVHCISWLPTGFAARLLHVPLHFKYIVTCHGGEITQPRFIKKSFMISTLRNASWIIAGNRNTKTAVDQLIKSPTPISIIHFGVDPEIFHRNLDPDFLRNRFSTAGKSIILTVADLKPRKGIDNTLHAVKKLSDKGLNILYLIVGNGSDMNRLKGLVREQKLSESVRFAGQVTDNELPYYYALCDIFVMPNRESSDHDIEGFGIAFIEAGATGKPVIGGRSGGVEDAITDKRTGFLVDGTKPDAIADAIETLLSDKELRTKMGIEGIERAHSLFQWDTVMVKTSMIYSKLQS
ncbi:MAG: glycosyltransferase family 4 protein [Fibrobacteres bacterium]|nr:glycosyltransferase family 4 protein [Fibrobacterota bacterium]